MATVRYADEKLCGSLNDLSGCNRAESGRKEEPRLVSEVESELGNLNNIIDDSFKLVYELKERLGNVLKSPKPENPSGINSRVSPDSNVGNSIREQSYKIEQVNYEVRELIERLAV